MEMKAIYYCKSAGKLMVLPVLRWTESMGVARPLVLTRDKAQLACLLEVDGCDYLGVVPADRVEEVASDIRCGVDPQAAVDNVLVEEVLV